MCFVYLEEQDPCGHECLALRLSPWAPLEAEARFSLDFGAASRESSQWHEPFIPSTGELHFELDRQGASRP